MPPAHDARRPNKPTQNRERPTLTVHNGYSHSEDPITGLMEYYTQIIPVRDKMHKLRGIMVDFAEVKQSRGDFVLDAANYGWTHSSNHRGDSPQRSRPSTRSIKLAARRSMIGRPLYIDLSERLDPQVAAPNVSPAPNTSPF